MDSEFFPVHETEDIKKMIGEALGNIESEDAENQVNTEVYQAFNSHVKGLPIMYSQIQEMHEKFFIMNEERKKINNFVSTELMKLNEKIERLTRSVIINKNKTDNHIEIIESRLNEKHDSNAQDLLEKLNNVIEQTQKQEKEIERLRELITNKDSNDDQVAISNFADQLEKKEDISNVDSKMANLKDELLKEINELRENMNSEILDETTAQPAVSGCAVNEENEETFDDRIKGIEERLSTIENSTVESKKAYEESANRESEATIKFEQLEELIRKLWETVDEDKKIDEIQNDRLDKIQSLLNELPEKIEMTEEKTRSVEEKTIELEKLIKDNISQINEKISKEDDRTINSDKKIHDLSNQMNEILVKIKDAEDKVDENNGKIERNDEKVRELEKIVNDVSEKLIQYDEKSNEALEKANTAIEKSESADMKVSEIVEKQNSLENKEFGNESRAEEAELIERDTEKKTKELVDDFKELKNKIENLEDKLKESNEKVNELESSSAQRVATLEEKTIASECALASRIAALEDNNLAADKRIQALEDGLKNTGNEIVEEEVSAPDNSIVEASRDDQNNDQNDRLSSLEKRVVELEAKDDSPKINDKLDECMNRLKTQNEEQRNRDLETFVNGTDFKKLKLRVKDLDDTIQMQTEGLNKNIVEVDSKQATEIEKLHQELSNTQKQLDSLEKVYNSRLKKLQKRLNEMQPEEDGEFSGTLEEPLERQIDLEVIIRRLTAVEEAYVTDGNQLTKRMGDLEADVGSRLEDIEAQYKNMEYVSGVERTDMLDRLDKLEEDSKRREDMMAETPRQILDVQQKLQDSLEASTEELKKEVLEVQKSVAQALMIEDDVDSLREQLKQLSEKAEENDSQAKERMDEMESDAKAREEAVDRVSGGISKMQTEIEQLKAAMEGNEKSNRKKFSHVKHQLENINEALNILEEKSMTEETAADEPNAELEKIKAGLDTLIEREREDRENIIKNSEEMSKEAERREKSDKHLRKLIKRLEEKVPEEIVPMEEHRDLQKAVDTLSKNAQDANEAAANDRAEANHRIHKLKKAYRRLAEQVEGMSQVDEISEQTAETAEIVECHKIDNSEFEDLKALVTNNDLANQQQIRKLKHHIRKMEKKLEDKPEIAENETKEEVLLESSPQSQPQSALIGLEDLKVLYLLLGSVIVYFLVSDSLM